MDGLNTSIIGPTSHPAASRSAQSRSSVRGYVAKSCLLLNCVGLTKTLTTTMSFSLRARSTSDLCPACNAPMVGTRPTVLFSCLYPEIKDFNSEIVFTTLILFHFKPCKGSKYLLHRKMQHAIFFYFFCAQPRFKRRCNLSILRFFTSFNPFFAVITA